MIFLPLRFYVKSILGILEVQSLLLAHLGALNIDIYAFLHFLNAGMYQIN